MTSIEGGMITTDDFEIYKLLKKCRAFGYNKDPLIVLDRVYMM